MSFTEERLNFDYRILTLTFKVISGSNKFSKMKQQTFDPGTRKICPWPLNNFTLRGHGQVEYAGDFESMSYREKLPEAVWMIFPWPSTGGLRFDLDQDLQCHFNIESIVLSGTTYFDCLNWIFTFRYFRDHYKIWTIKFIVEVDMYQNFDILYHRFARSSYS